MIKIKKPKIKQQIKPHLRQMKSTIPSISSLLSKKVTWGIGLVLGLVILAGLMLGWWSQRQNLQNLLFSPPASLPLSPSPSPASLAYVTITGQGFVPQTILIKKGSQVSWTNQDKKSHQVASDPHPSHLLLPGLGQGQLLSPGASFSLTFDQAGTFTYHDEENPLKFKGVVIVNE